MKDVNEIWEIYRSCWSENNAVRRTGKLKEIMSDDFEYRDPNIELRGYQELSDYMEQFQNEFTGASFTISDFNIHHDRILANWNMIDAEKNVVGNGADFALYESGKLKQITGFFKEG